MSSIHGILLVMLCFMIGSILTCPEECECPNEDVVDCSGHDLSVLPADLDPQVKVLDLSRNLFTTVPHDLQRIVGLRHVILAHNRIDALDAQLHGLSQLEVLDLSANTFRRAIDIQPSAFRNLTSLRLVDFSHNTIGTFPECESASLESLLLQNCSINALNPGVLKPFPGLKTLDLSRNYFPLISGQFASKTLTVFNLTDCGVHTVTKTALSKLKDLKHLDLSKNFELKSFTANSTSLQVLDLVDCNLESVPKGPFPNLTSINLNGNHIRRLEAGMLHGMSRVQVIFLGNNAVDYVDPDCFKWDYSLREVDLSHNTFRTLDVNIFKESWSLTRLNLGRTYLNTMIPFQCTSLIELDLTNCEIADLGWDSLKGMTHLETLILSGNLLNSIPNNLSSTSLMRLNLSNNRLTSIKNTTFGMLPKLQHLNIVGNRLVQLQFYPSFKNIRSFFLEDNPWRCECASKSFKIFYETLSVIRSDVDLARCQSPLSLEGKTWVEACSDEWFPWDFATADKAWMGSVIVMSVFALTCCLFIGINKECSRRKERLRQAERENQEIARQRLVTMIEAAANHTEEEPRNAPDPRESLGPPSYNEAITMPPLGSTASLYSRKDDISADNGNLGVPSITGSVAASLNNLSITSPSNSESRSKPRRKKRGKSPHRMSQTSQSSGQISNQLSNQRFIRSNSESTQSNPDLLDKSGRPLSAKAKRRRKRSRTRLQNMEDSSDSDFIETDM